MFEIAESVDKLNYDNSCLTNFGLINLFNLYKYVNIFYVI